MRRQSQLRYARIVDQAALHHVPSERALRRAEKKDADQHRRETRWDPAAQAEPYQRHQENDADRAPEQAMEIFPPENALERVDGHVAVDLAILGCRLILAERLVPSGRGKRRERSDDGLPFGDRQSRVREPRRTSDYGHREHQRAADEKPDGNGAWTRAIASVDRCRAGEALRRCAHRPNFTLPASSARFECVCKRCSTTLLSPSVRVRVRLGFVRVLVLIVQGRGER